MKTIKVIISIFLMLGVLHLFYLLGLFQASCGGTTESGPVCDNCHNITATYWECFHEATNPNSTLCSRLGCIEDVINTNTCDHHEKRTEPSQCKTEKNPAYWGFYLRIFITPDGLNYCNPSESTVQWKIYKDIWSTPCTSGNKECSPVGIEYACPTSTSCAGGIFIENEFKQIYISCDCPF